MSKLNGTLGLGLGLSAAAGVVLGACSLAVDFAECRDDADCLTQGDAQWQCIAGRCVEPVGGSSTQDPSTGDSVPTTGSPTDPGSSSGGTSTTAVTISTGDTGTSTSEGTGTDTDTDTTDTGSIVCALNTECERALGNGHLCIEGSCVSALTEDCVKLVWPSKGSHDKVVLIGSTIPVSPPYDTLTVPLQNAVQLAIEDYNATTDLPGGNRVAWIACDDRGSVERALTIAEHLTGTLKIQALVGPIFSEQVLAVAEQVTVPAGVFTITPTATAKSITTLKDMNLVWRPIASDVYQANALADRVLALSNPVATKVAMLGKDDAYGNGIISDVTKRLSPLLKAGFKTWPYSDPVSKTPDEIKAEYALILGEAWGPKGAHPDTMLFAGTSEVINLVLGTMSAWSAENPLPAAPRMIVTHGAVPSMEIMVNAAPMASKALMMQILEGLAPEIFDPENFEAFNLRYRLRFDGVDAITAGSLSYDAAMVTILGMAAIPQDEPITGAAIAKNMARLVDKKGTPVSFGEVDGTKLLFIEQAHNALVTNKNVDLKGVSGALDFDLTTGEVRTNVVGWGLVPKDGMPTVPVLTPRRIYMLNPPPAETGTWVDLP